MTKILCEWVMCKHNSLKEQGFGLCLKDEIMYEQKDTTFEQRCECCGCENEIITEEQLYCKSFEWGGIKK